MKVFATRMLGILLVLQSGMMALGIPLASAASCTSLRSLAGLQSITITEVTHSPATQIVLSINDERLIQDLPDTGNTADFITAANERYDFNITDANGVLNPNGKYLTIQDYRRGNSTTEADAANNIDAVTLTFADGTVFYADQVTAYRLGTNPVSPAGRVTSALGAPDYMYGDERGFTRLGNGVTYMTLAFNGAFSSTSCSVPTSSSSSSSSAEICPVSSCGAPPGSVNFQCSDGSVGGPTGRCLPNLSGGCSWEIHQCPQLKPQCSDGVDNDSDGLVDYFDQGCYVNGFYNPNDTDEFNAASSSSAPPSPACSDGRDNDNDGLTDYYDMGCYTNGFYNPNDNDEFNVPTSSSSSSSSSAATTGCINVVKEAFDVNNNLMSLVPQFAFILDHAYAGYNGGNGQVLFVNVPVGNHSVSEQVPNGWQQLYVTPANGSIYVQPGSACAVVNFKNKQML